MTKRPYSCWLAWHPDSGHYCYDIAPYQLNPGNQFMLLPCDSIRCRGGRVVWVRVVPQKPKARKAKP